MLVTLLCNVKGAGMDPLVTVMFGLCFSGMTCELKFASWLRLACQRSVFLGHLLVFLGWLFIDAL